MRAHAAVAAVASLILSAGPAPTWAETVLLTGAAPPGSRGVNLHDVRGRVVGTLPASGHLRNAQAVISLGTTNATLSGEPVRLPAGVYFVRPPGHGASPPPLPGPTEFRFHDVTPWAVPGDQWDAADIEAGDVNGDGRTDIVFSTLGFSCDTMDAHPFRIWIQTPRGDFVDDTEARVPLFRSLGYELELLDVDLDGDLDVFLSGYSCTDHHAAAALFINDGSGQFSNETYARLPQFGDDRFVFLGGSGLLDSDPFPDLALTIFASVALYDSTGLVVQPEIWLNSGAGEFHRAIGHLPPPGKYGYFGLSVADLTGDGREDIAFANTYTILTDADGQPLDTLSGQTALYRNLGDGHFADETGSRMPEGFERSQFWVPVADVDGDGDNDVLEVGLLWGDNTPQLRLLVNDGTGSFVAATRRGLDGVTGWFNRPRFGPLDDDAHADLFLPRVNPDSAGDDSDVLLVNNGGGIFGDFSSVLPDVIDFSVACALFDYDSDGDLDIATANSGFEAPWLGQNRLYRNWTVPVAVDRVASAPALVRLDPTFPNPVASWMGVRFRLPREGAATLAVFDVGGRFVRELTGGRLDAGEHEARWDLRDAAGRPVAAGLYFCRLEVEGRSLSTRFAVTR